MTITLRRRPTEREREAIVLPRYGGESLLNVPATICRALGAPTTGLAPPLDGTVLPPALLEGVSVVLLLIVDGLGREQLGRAIDDGAAPTLAELVTRASSGDADVSAATITSVFPPSTMPALATLNTGLAPARHALIGWTVYLEEFGEAAEIARWGPAAGFGSYAGEALGSHDPVAFFGLETISQRLGRVGVRSSALCPAIHTDSGLSAMLFRGAQWRGYHATSSIFAIAERILAERRTGERAYLYAYWPALDTVAHHCGPLGAEHREEVATVDFALGRWLRAHERRGDLLVVLTADHGHLASDPSRAVRLDRETALLGDLRSPPTGERRLAYLHARPGRAAAVRAYCAERLSRVADLLDPDEAFARGLFGPGPASPSARRRAGDLILVARGDHQFICPFSERQRPDPFIGNHGALDAREMLVPLLAMRL